MCISYLGIKHSNLTTLASLLPRKGKTCECVSDTVLLGIREGNQAKITKVNTL